MATKQTDAQTVNKFTSNKGITRTLEIEIGEDNSIDIELTISKDETALYKVINLNHREALSLIFYLISKILPYKFLANKTRKKKEE